MNCMTQAELSLHQLKEPLFGFVDALGLKPDEYAPLINAAVLDLLVNFTHWQTPCLYRG